MDSGRVLYARHRGVDVLRYEGDVRYPMAPSIERFITSKLVQGDGGELMVDLSDTESIDSTNLGLLARTANRMQERGGRRITIISSHGEIEELLNSMGFSDVFDIVHQQVPGATEEIPTSKPEATELARVMLDAHRSLMRLNDKNEAAFRDVVEMLEKDVGGGAPAKGPTTEH